MIQEDEKVSQFPVNDEILELLLHSLNGAYDVTEDGEWVLTGAEFSLNDLLEMLSGYQPEEVKHLEDNVVEYVGGTLFHQDDVIRSLVHEVKRLRVLVPLELQEPLDRPGVSYG